MDKKELGNLLEVLEEAKNYVEKGQDDVRIDIWTHFMRECIIDYVH